MTGAAVHPPRSFVHAGRHANLSLWPALIVIGMFVFLAAQLPPEALRFRARQARREAPSVSFVTLDAAASAATIRGVQMAWQLGRSGPGALEFDFGGVTRGDPPPPPRYLSRRPASSVPASGRPVLDVRPPSARLEPPTLSAAPVLGLPPEPVGVDVSVSPALAALRFVFPAPNAATLPADHGEGSFRVVTDATGAVEAVLVLPGITARSAADPLRRALARGHATGATNGLVRIIWNRPAGPTNDNKETK